MKPLADDDASNGMAVKARESLAAMAKHNIAMHKYAKAYILKLRDALQHIEQTEQDNAETSNRTHQG